VARIACLFVADFPLAALRRAEPDLRATPLVTVDRDEPRTPLTAISPEARALGARVGLGCAQARAISSAIVVRRLSSEVGQAAQAALLDVAESFSPRVENAAAGMAYLDIDGLQSLFGSEAHLATSLVARLRRVGLEGRVGVASTKTAARLAAQTTAGVEVVSAGDERRRIAVLPVSILEPADDLSLTLGRWGIRSCGQLAALPITALAWRFGDAGIRAWRIARGEDDGPLVVRPRAARFEEATECGYAIDSFEPLSFLLRAVLERLTARLDIRGLRAGDLALSLRVEGGAREERLVQVAAPTNDVKSLLALLRLHFDRRPPAAAVEWFRLTAVAERLRPIELDLFVRAGPTAQDLGLALMRLTAIAGAERVGCPAVVDSHRPDVFAVERFTLTGAPSAATARPEDRCSAVGLRAFRPPAALDVVCDRGRPDFVRARAGESFGGRVVTLAGPWRTSGEWWRNRPLARDYFDAELSDGGVYRIYREHRSDEWFADGVYD
jgi:protein ImuB